MIRFPIGAMHDFAQGDTVWRAYQHLFAARDGAVLVVPTTEVWGPFDGVLDGLPLPWAEAWCLLSADHEHAGELTPVQLSALQEALSDREATNDGQALRMFLQRVVPVDTPWSHQLLQLDGWGGRCRLFMGRRGVRMAFTRDWLATTA
ncbi:hypothetical protein [Burkholderia cenocepacia]|uniref:hypothetical protein n=1 Tax=Burkholderia cenocepacia TaxID=95486 RepID=UPI001B92E527|nr:hypothetical protein [Burkholderia cenocepacia]MBR8137215.1 hypothetical protein [Burkholderia cenocepacia]